MNDRSHAFATALRKVTVIPESTHHGRVEHEIIASIWVTRTALVHTTGLRIVLSAEAMTNLMCKRELCGEERQAFTEVYNGHKTGVQWL